MTAGGAGPATLMTAGPTATLMTAGSGPTATLMTAGSGPTATLMTAGSGAATLIATGPPLSRLEFRGTQKKCFKMQFVLRRPISSMFTRMIFLEEPNFALLFFRNQTLNFLPNDFMTEIEYFSSAGTVQIATPRTITLPYSGAHGK